MAHYKEKSKKIAMPDALKKEEIHEEATEKREALKGIPSFSLA